MRFVILSILAVSAAFAAESKFSPTHRQAGILKPAREGSEIEMSSFVLDRDGNIVAAVKAASAQSRGGIGAKKSSVPQGWLQIYSPDKKLAAEYPLDFPPTAVALAPDGGYYAAGEGHLCKLTKEGKITDSTNITTMLGLDPKKLKAEAIEEYRKERAEMNVGMEEQRKAIEDQIKRIETKKEADRTARDKARLESLKTILAQIAPAAQDVPAEEIAEMISRRMYIPSISASPEGVVVTLSRNRGYEVWRTGLKFEKPKELIGGLRGCCGQMDVFASGDKIFAAENTKFKVGIYGLDGKMLSSFGERFEKDNNGFGSCCNPMNVITCSNGDILTAESSIGHIKRFSADGKLLGVVGRARIGGGCKHVSLGFDEKRDRYYVQYEDMNHICIMLPNKEAGPLVAEQDRLQNEADAAVLKLAGKWKLTGTAAKKPGDDGEFSLSSFETKFATFELRADHSVTLAVPSGSSARDNGFRRWLATGMEGGNIVAEFERDDGYVDFVAKIERKGDNEIVMMIGNQKKTFRRETKTPDKK